MLLAETAAEVEQWHFGVVRDSEGNEDSGLFVVLRRALRPQWAVVGADCDSIGVGAVCRSGSRVSASPIPLQE